MNGRRVQIICSLSPALTGSSPFQLHPSHFNDSPSVFYIILPLLTSLPDVLPSRLHVIRTVLAGRAVVVVHGPSLNHHGRLVNDGRSPLDNHRRFVNNGWSPLHNHGGRGWPPFEHYRRRGRHFRRSHGITRWRNVNPKAHINASAIGIR